MGFFGNRVLALESRRAAETAELIRRNGGEPFVAPSMRERAIEQNESAFDFAERLFRGEFDMVIFLTGVGTRYLARAVGTRYPVERFAQALGKVTTVARGPKPVAALRELSVPVIIAVPEPNTWREVLDATSGRPERRIAVQEYGRPATELEEGLRARGAEVMPVRVYEWDLPEDRGPLEEAARGLAAAEFHTVLFTTSFQLVHLMRVAKELGIEAEVRSGLRKTRIASIGPTTSEMLREYGLEPALEASHPKLGFLVKEAAEAD
ncbi:MAG TPA: uroporphyrinogen-III synthase [Bryobacteraceae bacterium]|nr:uroporphyrinogen-III synthase [Bryobacteraceae bacterium]